MDTSEQPRLSESKSLIAAMAVFVVLLPILWILLSILSFVAFLSNYRGNSLEGVIPFIAAATILTDFFLTRAFYKYLRSPDLTMLKDPFRAAIGLQPS